MVRLVAARHQGIPQSSVEEGAHMDPGEGDQEGNHNTAHWPLGSCRMRVLGGRVLPGPCQAAAGWNGAELSARPLVAHQVCSLHITQQADGHQP